MTNSDRTEHVTTTTTTNGGSTGMAFIVGILVVVVGFLAYAMFGGSTGGDTESVNITIEGAADAVGDTVEGTVTSD